MSLGSIPANDKTVPNFMREYEFAANTNVQQFVLPAPVNVVTIYSTVPLYLSLRADLISGHPTGDDDTDALRLKHPGGNMLKMFFQEQEFKDIFIQSRTTGATIEITPGRFVGSSL